MVFRLTSSAFDAGETIPLVHTCEGKDLSPPLEWRDVPSHTRSLALTCVDPDAPGGAFHHWAIYDLPPGSSRLPAGIAGTGILANQARQAVNDFGRLGYGGPCPPRALGAHHYHFRLHALDVEDLDLADRPRCRDVLKSLAGHTLGVAELVGVFRR